MILWQSTVPFCRCRTLFFLIRWTLQFNALYLEAASVTGFDLWPEKLLTWRISSWFYSGLSYIYAVSNLKWSTFASFKSLHIHRYISFSHYMWQSVYNVDKKNQLDVTFCILYFYSSSCWTCFGQPCAHHQELTTAWCYSLVLICAVAAGRWSSPAGR